VTRLALRRWRTGAAKPLRKDQTAKEYMRASTPDSGFDTTQTNTADAAPQQPPRASNRHMARAFSLQLVFRLLGMTASMVTVAATTRYLGPTDYGKLTTAVMFVGLWMSLTELGVGATIVRRVMSGTGDLERLVRVNAGLSLGYCVPLFAIAAASGALVYRDQTDVTEMVLIVSASLILSTIATCIEPIFLAKVRFSAVAMSDLASRVVSLGATMILLGLHANLVWFATVQLVPPAVILVVQGVAAARITNWRPIVSLTESWDLFRESLPQTGGLVVAILYWRADGVILSIRSTHEQVGVYGLAVALAFTLSMLSQFFATTTLSAMTHLFARDRAEFAQFVTRSVEVMLFIGAPIAVVGAMLAEPVIELVGSEEFGTHGGPTLALLFVAVALVFVTAAISQALFAAHDQVFLLRLSIVNLVGNIVLNIVLAPHYGAIGAAAALVVTEAIGAIVATWRLGRRAPYRTPWLFIVRLLPALAACSGAALAMRHLPVLITISVAALLYLAVNLGVGPVTVHYLKAALSEEEEQEDPDDSMVSNETPN
jgi:O-antigen/teichoic acid export membrane protein